MKLSIRSVKSVPRFISASLLILNLFSPPYAQQPSLDKKLFSAIGQNDLLSVERLIREGANIEGRETNGMTPLMDAAEHGNVPLLSLLLESGAKPNVKDEQGETALSWAARGGWVREVSLLAILSDAAAKNHALFEAIRGGPVGIAVVDANLPGPPQPQPSEVVESWTATVEELIARGADLEARSEDDSTPLLEAAAYAKTDIFKLLMEKGAHLNVKDKYGNTPLLAAACQCAVATMNNADEVIQILLDSGADVNARNHDGETVLMMASGMSGDASVLGLLLRYHANPEAKDRKGMTALAIARKSFRDDKIAILNKVSTR
jgi:ankyrin repeat protein